MEADMNQRKGVEVEQCQSVRLAISRSQFPADCSLHVASMLRATLSPESMSTDSLHLGCFSGTRTDVLSKVTAWFDDRSAPNVLWLCGAPGTGKTTISWSLIAELKRQQRLAGVFLFGHREHTPFKLWPTLAYQMASFHPAIEAEIHDAIATRTNDILDSNDVNNAYRKLVSDPLRATNGLLSDRGPIFLIDSLEKCSHDQEMSWEELLETLGQWPSSLPRHCKLIITSRPQSDITNAFGCRDFKRIDLLTGDDVDEHTGNDVHTYLYHRFAEMRKQDSSIQENWPDYDAISKLADHTRGFFTWAAVAVNGIKEAAGDRKRHLAAIIQGGTTIKFDDFDPYLEKILKTALGSNPSEAFRATVMTIALSEQPLTMADLRLFLQSRFSYYSSRAGFPDDMCYRLLSIVSVEGESKTIKIRHQAYRDYLIDSKRCTLFDGEFRSKTHRKMTISCLKIMQQGLKFNICGLKSSYQMNREIEGRDALVEKCIPSHLAYACQHWAQHLRGIDPTEKRYTAIFDLVRKFLNSQFLYWLEVLSLLSKSHLASTSLLAAAKWLEVYRPTPSVQTL
jgi:hypothetical protein